MLSFLLAVAALPMPAWPVSSDDLARYWAPTIVQEARSRGSNHTQDLPVAFDFDGDWSMRNNWDSQPAATRNAQPVVHFAAVATEKRAYLTYYLFYPRDWSYVCVPMICHENDLEQFTMVVENDGSVFGRVAGMDVKFHTGYRSYPAPYAGAQPRERTKARLWQSPEGRPVVRVEWGGHGVLSCDTNGDGRRDDDCDPTDGAFQLLPAGATPLPMRARVPVRTYALKSLRDTLWSHRDVSSGTWQARTLHYEGSRLGRLGGALGVAFAGSGPGGGARAPWGVTSTNVSPGERFFDPAVAFDARWAFRSGRDLTPYVEHAYLDDLRQENGGGTNTASALARPTP